jgi:hypothetical protein
MSADNEFKPYCVFKAVKEVWITPRTVYLIHSPATYFTATELEQWYRAQGYNVYRLNTGVEEDRIFAEQLMRAICDEQ